jgi:hypothetical protein
MKPNEIKIKYQVNEDGSVDIKWSIHPDMKIKDLLFIFNGSKNAITQAAANKAKKEGIPTKKISSWLKDKSIKDLS